MVDDDDFAIVKIFPAPNVTGKLYVCLCAESSLDFSSVDNSFCSKNKINDLFFSFSLIDNSDDNITYWLKPSVKDDGVKLTLGK